MKNRRNTPEQIVRKLREADRMPGEGMELLEVMKALEVSEATCHRWRAQHGGMKADDVKRLKELERENSRLKRTVADQMLDIEALKETLPGKLLSPSRRRRAVLMVQDRFGLSERGPASQHRSTQRSERVMTRCCGHSCAGSLAGSRGGGIAGRISCCARTGGSSIWREEGLRVPRKRRKRQRLGGIDRAG